MVIYLKLDNFNENLTFKTEYNFILQFLNILLVPLNNKKKNL
jgi:hypothetical protein